MTPTVVLGGTGKTGRRIVARLTALEQPVRVGSRTGRPAFDWERPETWGAALAGAGAVYLAYAPDLASPGAADTIEAVARCAVQQGAERLVLLSGRGEPEAQRCERLVQEAGVSWTVLRCSFFAQGFSESFLADGVRAGVLALPTDESVAEPFVDVEDVAELAVAALTRDGHDGQVYECTGPTALTWPAAVAAIAASRGRSMDYERLPARAWATALSEQGVPGDLTALLTYLFTEVSDGRNSEPQDGVQRGLGREPGSFAAYVDRTAATGAWG